MMDHSIASESTEAAPRIERVRHELRRRNLEVRSVTRLTPNMIRIILGGAELEGFTSLSAGDHIKVFVPDETGETVMRDYTPRHYDGERQLLTLDFAVHDAGPATRWAMNAQVGDRLQIGGPRGSQIISGPIRHWLLIGDETALPSIGRRVEEMQAGTSVTTIVGVADVRDEQQFESLANVTTLWVHRKDPTDASGMLDSLKNLTIEPGTFIWLAAEGSVAKTIRNYLLTERRHPQQWLRAFGYWVRGKADTTEKFED